MTVEIFKMFWKYKRRLRQSLCRCGYYYISIVIFFILFANIMVLQRNFATLEGENYVDPGGTRPGEKLTSVDFKTRLSYNNVNIASENENILENKLRKLLDIMEINLETPGTFDTGDPGMRVGQYFPELFFDCEDVANMTDWQYLASGWTKAVYRAGYRGTAVAVKTVDPHAQEMSTCLKRGESGKTCYLRAAKKIVKEIVVLQALANENVLKVLGFCLPRSTDDNRLVAMVTELGEYVDLIKLLQMSWEDRLRVSLDITKLVEYLSRTPYGSMAMNDFRRQQFVLVDGTLKLSDVDDSSFTDPTCRSDNECQVTFSSSNFTQRTPCIRERCVKYNEKRNVFNAGRDFVTFLLPPGAPILLQPYIAKIVDGFSNLSMTAKQLLDALNNVKTLYQSGWYMNRTNTGTVQTSYKKLVSTDFPGLHDYRCRFSLSVVGCTISVFDLLEAEQVCDMDDECRGFVMSSSKTWTGRTLVHLKNGNDHPSFNSNTTVYLKPG